jgi:transforming growth factor-beta-induced protein
MRRTLIAAAALTGAFTLGACSETAMEPMSSEMSLTSEAMNSRPDFAGPKKDNPPIAQIAIDNGFSELVGALAYVDGAFTGDEGYTPLIPLFLEGTDQFTVFAPTNEAFDNLYALLSVVLDAEIDEISDIPASVVLDVLFYHVVEGRRASNSVVPKNGERTMTSLLGEDFFVRTDLSIRDGLTGLRDDASIVPPFFDLSASNGFVHVISQVIVPPSVVAALTS